MIRSKWSKGLVASGLALSAAIAYAKDNNGPKASQRHSNADFKQLEYVLAQAELYDQPEILTPNTDISIINAISNSNALFDERDPQEFHHLIPPARNIGSAWHIYKTAWDEEDEIGYKALITAIGRSKCVSLDECLRDPANPYRDLESDEIYYGDCADMAYFMRGYYAWKNGLPFSYQHQMRTADKSGDDLRYSKRGNVVTGRRSAITPSNGKPIYAPDFLKRIGGEVSTAMFRTHPITGTSGTFDDFYPVEPTRDALRSGSIAYDVFGHVGLVFEIETDGRVLVVASHPDFTITRSLYGPNFMRTGPEFGGGLKAWRPIKLVGAKKQKDGTYKGGRIVGAKNEDSPGFSMVQYEGTNPDPSGDWRLGEFRYNGRTLNYYDYVKASLAGPDYKANPVREMRNEMRNICSELQSRRIAVKQAVDTKIHLKDHPERLPPNIYGTFGTWEAYSTPSRDARLKTSFVEARRLAQDLVEIEHTNPDILDYHGDDLPGELLHVFEEESLSCRITYQRSDESYVKLHMGHVIPRLFDMSFDPYHCPERRWGASGYELRTCTDTNDKAEWYDAQRFMRYQVDRTYDIFTGFKKNQLRAPDEAPANKGGLGVIAPPDIDTYAYLIQFNKPHRNESLKSGLEILRHSDWLLNKDNETKKE